MPQKPEAGDVGGGGRPKGAQGGRRRAGTLAHGLQRRLHPPGLGRPPHVRSEHHPRAHRLGQHNRLPWLEPPLGLDLLLLDRPVDGEAERQLSALARVAAHEGAVGLRQRGGGARHHLYQVLLHLLLQPEGNLGDGEGGDGLGPHPPAVP
eukprot:1194115-Prorocentrum_minimum.AAC.3